MRVLAGDIGGTNARLAIVDIDVGGIRLLRQQRFASRAFPGLASIIRTFLADAADAPSRACFGVAGPVVEGVCSATNLPWTVDRSTLAAEIGIPHVIVINDLHATGCAVQQLGPADLVTLQAGERETHGVIAIIGAGTGLGQAFLTWCGDGYRVHDSEGGHATFSAITELEHDLARWLVSSFGHVSNERVLSGPGLVNIYHYLATRGNAAEQASIRAEMESGDAAAVIARHALAATDALSMQALGMFVSAYGARAGNLALSLMATGGVYVAGGIAPRITPALLSGEFMTAFRSKGRMADILARIPVQVIINSDVGIIGAAEAALHHWPERHA